jgi:hypothetical protein
VSTQKPLGGAGAIKQIKKVKGSTDESLMEIQAQAENFSKKQRKQMQQQQNH